MHIKALQRNRINRVMNFARNCESEALTLESLADVACLSRYHFSRVFTGLCRETPIEFLSRMRLEQSVSKLIFQPQLSVTAIALEADFSSSQAFSNAFRRRFGTSPRAFRAKNTWYINEFPKNQYVLSPLMSKLLVSPPPLFHAGEVTVKTIPAARLAYIRHRGSYYYPSEGRNATLRTLVEWAKLRGIWQKDTLIFGVCPDNSAVTPPHFCQYDTGIAVEEGVDEDEIISIQHLPETTLATLEVSGPLVAGREAWKWFISDWLPRSGMNATTHVFYEKFRFNEEELGSSKKNVQLCMPVSACNTTW